MDEIVRKVAKEEGDLMFARQDEAAGFLVKVVQSLKQDPNAYLELKVASLKKLQYKQSSLKGDPGIGDDMKRLVLKPVGKDGDRMVVLAQLLDKAPEQAATGASKKKRGRKGGKPASATGGHGAGSAEEGTDQLIQQIVSGQMPQELLPPMLTKRMERVSKVQQTLDAPGTQEQDKPGLRKQLELNQRVIDAIKKRLGQ